MITLQGFCGAKPSKGRTSWHSRSNDAQSPAKSGSSFISSEAKSYNTSSLVSDNVCHNLHADLGFQPKICPSSQSALISMFHKPVSVYFNCSFLCSSTPMNYELHRVRDHGWLIFISKNLWHGQVLSSGWADVPVFLKLHSIPLYGCTSMEMSTPAALKLGWEDAA